MDSILATQPGPATTDAAPETVAGPAPPLAAVLAGLPRIAGYELLGILGRGGMGVVYKARQTRLDRLVALKVVLTSDPRPDELARFQTEAEAVGRVSHPNLVAVYEVGEWRENEHAPPVPYLALEYVPGGTLEQHLAGKPMPPRQAARLVEQLACALHVVHQQGVIHRDLKPANVLMAEDGSPKISDFGLARKLNAASGVTQSGAVLGTPAYMAPEQAAGHTSRVGAAADLHALGVILYQALTAKLPFLGATAWETMQRVMSEAPAPPGRLAPGGVPRDLETICLKCLEKDPAHRYPDARALAEDLARFAEGRPIEARPAAWYERAWMWARRNPAPAALLALCALCGVGLLAASQLYQARLRQAVQLAEDRAAESRERLVQLCVMQGNQADDDGEHAFALAWYVEAVRLKSTGAGADALSGLMQRRRVGVALRGMAQLDQMWFRRGAARVGAVSPDGKLVLAADDGGGAQVYDAGRGAAVGRAVQHRSALVLGGFLPSGRRFVLGGRDGALLLGDAQTGAVTPLAGAGHKKAIAALAVANAAMLTASEEGTFHLWKCGDVPALVATGRHGGELLAAALSPAGGHVVTAGGDGQARLWRGGELVAALPHPACVGAVSFSPDGRLIATGCGDGGVRLWGLDGKPRGGPWRHRADVVDVQFAPDGRRLVSASDDHTAVVWDVASGARLVEVRHASGVNSASFDASGERIATTSDDNTARLWWAESGERHGGELRYGGTVLGTVFMPDGRLLAHSADGTVRLWRARPRPRPAAPRAMVHTPRPTGTPGPWRSPDGALVLSVESDHSARLSDARTGQAIGAALPHGSGVVMAAFAPRGDKLVTAGDDNLARLWSARGEAIGRPMPHRGGVRLAKFSDDGTLLVTGSADQSARVWNTATGLPIVPPLRLPAAAERVSFAAGDVGVTIHLAGGGAVEVDLRPDERPIEELTRLAQVLSGRLFDDKAGLVPLPPGRLGELWEGR